MKKITQKNYKTDKLYRRVAKAVHEILSEKDFIAPIEVFIRMDLLSREDVENWRFRRVSCLERVIQCNLSKANRILRILKLHAYALNLKPSYTGYMKWGKGPKIRLRFSRSGARPIEEAYSRHYVVQRARSRTTRETQNADSKSAPVYTDDERASLSIRRPSQLPSCS